MKSVLLPFLLSPCLGELNYSLLNDAEYWKQWAPSKSNTTWRTCDRKIIHNEKPFYVKGVNLNGIESACVAPLGLWDHSLSYYLDFMIEHKFNAIRLPVSYEAMHDLTKGVGQCVGAEQHLRGGMPVGELIKFILDEAAKRNIYVLVDLHTIGGHITPDPWTDTVTENNVIEAWVNFMKRYGAHPALFAVEIKNEPHGVISMEEFVNHCAKVVQRIISDVPAYQGLFVISGVEYKGSAWGGSFGSDAKASSTFQGLGHPNALCLVGLTDRYVLNPHVYGTDVRGSGVAWENGDAWERYYGFLQSEESHWKDAVILVTEYGGFMKEGGTDRDYYERWLAWHLGKGYTAGGFHWTLDERFSSDTGGLIGKHDSNAFKLEFCGRLTPNPTLST